MQLLITGMTRDGLLLIEGGRIARGVKNMRFNDSPLRVMKNIRRFGKPEPTTLHGQQVVPPVLADGFHFTSTTSF
jgi:predicted Zn-dependent protease